MQRKRNRRLLFVLLGLIIIVVVTYALTRPADRLQVNRDIFAFETTSEINRVTFSNDTTAHTLAFDGARWNINGEYNADPQRVSVLFAILKQMRVRRKVARQQQDSIRQKLLTKGTHVTFYEGDRVVHQFYIWGESEHGLTYVTDAPGKPVYIVEIPGYRSFLAGIYMLDVNGWRDPLVFDLNRSNLRDVTVMYPREPESGFTVEFDDRKQFYLIPRVSETDSSRLVDFLDDLSLLYVNDYLFEDEVKANHELIDGTPQSSFKVRDVGDNVYTLEIYEQLSDEVIIGRIDSTDYAVFDLDKIREIMRPRRYFIEKK